MDTLSKHRVTLDALDQQIITLLAQRIAVAHKINVIKKRRGLSALDRTRWLHVLRTRQAYAQSLGLEKALVAKLYRVIHAYVLTSHTKV